MREILWVSIALSVDRVSFGLFANISIRFFRFERFEKKCQASVEEMN